MHGGIGAGTIERAGGEVTAGRPDGRTAGILLLLVMAVWPSGRLAAQDTTTVRDTAMFRDTTRHGVRPMGAFWRSFLIPGWGQAVTGRTTTGAAFVAWEGVSAMMTLKAQQELNYFRSIHSANVELKKQEVQDWAVLWVFNHLFAGAEAYVSAHLRDFPPDLKVRAYPGGIGVTFPIHE